MLMEARNNIKFILLSMKYNVQREMLNKTSFLMNVLLMMLNNVSIIIQWGVFFSLKDSFNGYTFEDEMFAISLCTITYGMTFLFFGGVNRISYLIEYGGLDKYLTKPKSILISVLTSKTQISALGDMLFGIILFLIYYHNPIQILLFIFLSILSFFIMISFLIIINSITFWFIRFSDTVETFHSAFISFSMYPKTIFDTSIKIIMHTIIPVGFAIYLPVELFINFSILKMLLLVGFTIFNVLLARFVFYRGLKRYTSSNIVVANI